MKHHFYIDEDDLGELPCHCLSGNFNMHPLLLSLILLYSCRPMESGRNPADLLVGVEGKEKSPGPGQKKIYYKAN